MDLIKVFYFEIVNFSKFIWTIFSVICISSLFLMSLFLILYSLFTSKILRKQLIPATIGLFSSAHFKIPVILIIIN